jgi:hypothetical protein
MGRFRYLPTRRRIPSRLSTPLPGPNSSHASEMRSGANPLNRPPPTTRLCGSWVLKKNGSPGARLRNSRRSPGRQKLTSPSSGRAARNSNQLWSVTPTYALTHEVCGLGRTGASAQRSTRWSRHRAPMAASSSPPRMECAHRIGLPFAEAFAAPGHWIGNSARHRAFQVPPCFCRSFKCWRATVPARVPVLLGFWGSSCCRSGDLVDPASLGTVCAVFMAFSAVAGFLASHELPGVDRR